jgi:hypothetical protein
MTSDSFEAMDEAEQRDLARRLWEGSEVFDFDSALELVRRQPDRARFLLRMRAETKRRQEERARGLRRLRQARIQEFG